MTTTVHELHGLCVASDVPLPEPECDRPADVDVRLRAPLDQTKEFPEHAIVAQVDPQDVGYVLAETESGWTLRYAGLCDFEISRDTRRVDVRLIPGGDADLLPVLLTGNVLGFLLALRGEPVIHASAIEASGSIVAIVGASGMGKSTLTALFCAEGARLVSDDLLRLESSGAGTFCFEGTALVRLRPAAAELASLFARELVSETSDGRIALQVERAAGSRFRLDAMLIPQPSREAPYLEVSRLSARDALVDLVRYPRVLGWRGVEPSRRLFHVMAEVASTIPVYRAQIPWGPPFAGDLARRLLEQMEIEPRTVPAEVVS